MPQKSPKKKVSMSPDAKEEEDEDEGVRVNWIFLLGPWANGDLSTVRSVKVEEVSVKTPIPMFEGKPELDDKNLMIVAKRDIVSEKRYAWLYDKSNTPFIFRIEMRRDAAPPDVLVQAVLVTAIEKQQLKALGYL